MLIVETIPVTAFAQNARVLVCSETKECVVIDPGGEPELIIAALTRLGVTPKAVWLTHSHLDHCGGVAKIMERYKCGLAAHPGETVMRDKVEQIAAMYGIPAGELERCPEPSEAVTGGETLGLGKLDAQVLFTPGHSPGHVCFYFESERALIAGDTVFAGSIGRTDLPGGEYGTLIRSIREHILVLPDETRILSGHGPDTDVGREKRTNPFLQER